MISSCFSEEQHDQIKDTISSGNVSVFYARTYKMLYDLLISSEWGFSPKMKSTTLFSWTQSENVLKSKNLAYSLPSYLQSCGLLVILFSTFS